MKKRAFFTSWDSVPIILDLKYVAAILGVSNETVRKACINAEIPAFKIASEWRVNKKDLMLFCKERSE